jgi:Beta-glucosidase-related glycosidases
MKKTKNILSLALSICLVISLAGCGNLETTTTINEDVTTTTEAESDESVDQISEIVSSMTVEQKISQMIVISMRSDVNNTKSVTELTQEYKDIIQKYDFGGVLLMVGNFVDTDQTVDLIYDCQEAAKSSELGIPMFISTDQEGGRVNRMSYGSTGPGNMAMAASGDTELTKEFAGIIGRELSSVGCNVDFAPVSDVNNNPNNPIINVRSFSDDPEIVAENVGPFIEGLKENNILVSLKHFPGHENAKS